jgi:UDPglucose 6-dehydrogenase
MGNEVLCLDIDRSRIAALSKGEIPIFEPYLEDLIGHNRREGRMAFTEDPKAALTDCTICFITVGTPEKPDGGSDLSFVLAAAESIGRHMSAHLHIVDKSTVPVGTADLVKRIIQEELIKRQSNLTFDVISNPEFLKEGSAVNDCMRPERIIIGTDNDQAAEIMRELYLPFIKSTENFIYMDVRSAEMTKYAANAMLAAKISLINEIANICERVGADINKVRIGIGSDPRIGYQFIYAGCGYGGSCFSKDLKAIIRTGEKKGYDPELLKAIENVNQRQKQRIPDKIALRFGEDLTGRAFAVWGLAFKPDTDDMREAPAIAIIRALIDRGASIRAFDPKAMKTAETLYFKDEEGIAYAENPYAALDDADALILITEWKEFRSPDFDEMRSRLKFPIIFDGRNQYDHKMMQKHGFEYHQTGAGVDR